MSAILTLAGAFLWRLRGGLLNDLTGKENWMGFNDTVVRLIWSAGMALGFWWLHPAHRWLGDSWAMARGVPVWVGCGLLGLALFAGVTVFGWRGADIVPQNWNDVGALSESGILRMTFSAVLLQSPVLILAGLLFGPAYWLGARIPRWRRWMFWGEIICGAVIGACLTAA
ncbi:MAG: hypothetical protein KGH75_09315 [Rhodospirillales bacterium]|nr:hypothetical protein [Rhodospirillales bacterium]